MPRRARQLIPATLQRRGEFLAACATAIVLAHLLLAQLTLVLAVVFAVVSRTSRWRLWWLLCPALAGLAWILVSGPGNAFAGFAAGPGGVLRYLSGRYLGSGPLFERLGHPLGAFAGAGNWLPRQFPVALLAGAAEAAVIGWLDWLHTDEWAVRPPRPGAVAALRAARTTGMIRAGAVVTRDGCALGVAPATGALVELSWREVASGVLVVGAQAREVTITSLQLVHAALRRRKPLLVLDHGGDTAIVAALMAACRATGTPLRTAGAPVLAGGRGGASAGAGTMSASELWGQGRAREPLPPGSVARGPRAHEAEGIDLAHVVRERAAALLPADSPELAAQASADITALADYLRRTGADGDGLVWVPSGDRVPAAALAELIRSGGAVGLPVLVGTTSPAVAAELAATVGALLIHRIADPGLAGRIATRTGTRLLPASAVAALSGQPPQASGQPPEAPGAPGMAPYGGLVPAAPGGSVPVTPPAPALPQATDLVPCPAVTARTLLSLGPAEFVLTVSSPRQRLVTLARMVPARLPHTAHPAHPGSGISPAGSGISRLGSGT
jgi:hypothetical protein